MAVRKTARRKTTAKRKTVRKAAAKRPAARKTTAKRKTARKAPARKKAVAKKAAPKRKMTAKKVTGKTGGPGTVTLAHLVAELAAAHDLPKKATAELFDDFVALTKANLKAGNKVRLTGMGILQVRKRAARMGRNPQTGEPIKIKASKKVGFRVAKDLKEAVL